MFRVFSKWSISKQMVVSMSGLLLASLGLMTAVVGITTYSNSLENAQKIATVSSEKTAEFVRAFFENSLARSEGLALTIQVENDQGASRAFLD
jgi:hypothetical protein